VPKELLAYTVKYAHSPFALDMDRVNDVPVVLPDAVVVIDPPLD
jgi:ABC-type sulfate transport system permease component